MERSGRVALLSQTPEGTPDGAARHRNRSVGELCRREGRRATNCFPSAPLAPEQPRRELAPARPPARVRSTTVQEPAARSALLFGVQYGLQPVSARPPCTLSPQLSHGDAPTLAGMGRRLRDDGVRGRGMRSRSKPPLWSRADSTSATRWREQLDNARAGARAPSKCARSLSGPPDVRD